ncbi:stability protein StbE [Neisseria iguanae]|uniref:Stability protein StbE n=1 Tax=Neisseria iguanae TaxID=90242 RepID=A0A2P7U048_9NEIS|nr:stability protein StbE [Neisseria iguanae]
MLGCTKSALYNLPDCYKIKLKRAGCRLVYQVQDDIVTVISIGKRDKKIVYIQATGRI